MRAKSFFYICAGLMMLAAAYMMGARSVEAEQRYIATSYSAYNVGNTGNASAVIGRYFVSNDPGPIPSDPVPGTSTIVATLFYGNANWSYALLENGELWLSDNGGAWLLESTLNTGTIAVDPATMGEVKAKFK